MKIGLVIAAALVLQACPSDEPLPVGETSDPGRTPAAAQNALVPPIAGPPESDAADEADRAAAISPPEQDAPPAAENVDPGPQVDEIRDPSPETGPGPEPGGSPSPDAPPGTQANQDAAAPPQAAPQPAEPDQPILRTVRESGQAIGHPIWSGSFLTGWEHYVYFENSGPAGRVTITAEVSGNSQITATSADPLTKSFDIEAGERYIATIEFDVGNSDLPNWVLNTADQVCGIDPLTGLTANCACARSNLSLSVGSVPTGLSSGGLTLGSTCGMFVQLRDIAISVAPEPTPTPEPGLDILEWTSTFAELEDSLAVPVGIAFGPDGNVYVSVGETDRLLIFDPSGALQTTIGTGPGSANEGDLRAPAGVAVDGEGNVYVAETRNNRIQAFTQSGDLLFSQGERGSDEGDFSSPQGIALSSRGDLYVADSSNDRIQVFDTAGNFLREWDSKEDADTALDNPTAVAVGPDGLVYVGDKRFGRVQVFTADGVYQTGWPIMIGDRIAGRPRAVAIDSEGIVYAAANFGWNDHIVLTDTSGNYIDSWTLPFVRIGGIAISPDSRSLYVTTTRGGDGFVDVLTINRPNIP